MRVCIAKQLPARLLVLSLLYLAIPQTFANTAESSPELRVGVPIHGAHNRTEVKNVNDGFKEIPDAVRHLRIMNGLEVAKPE